MPKPTIAALPGAATGAALDRAGLRPALRRADRGADDSLRQGRLCRRLWRHVVPHSPRRVRQGPRAVLFSDKLSAPDAERLGLVNAIFPAETFTDDVAGRARQLAAGPTVAYRYMKENLNRAVHGELGECLDMEAAHHIRTGQTEDHKEAAKAFVDRRVPVFKGR